MLRILVEPSYTAQIPPNPFVPLPKRIFASKVLTSLAGKLQANEEMICHRADNPEPVLFTFGAKHMFAPKKKMCLRIYDSEWSSKTPLDAVGQSGTLMAKSSRGDQIYAVSFSSTLTIAFSPTLRA